jgi:hypothetical protein
VDSTYVRQFPTKSIRTLKLTVVAFSEQYPRWITKARRAALKMVAVKSPQRGKSQVKAMTLSELEKLYAYVQGVKKVAHMAQVLRHWETHHNVMLGIKDRALVDKAVLQPRKASMASMTTLYAKQLCGMEERHGSYKKYEREQAQKIKQHMKKPPTTNSPKKKKITSGRSAYVAEQCITRGTELQGTMNAKGAKAAMEGLHAEYANQSAETSTKRQKTTLSA